MTTKDLDDKVAETFGVPNERFDQVRIISIING